MPSHNNLDVVLAGQGNFEKAVVQFSQAKRINPGYENIHYNFKLDLQLTGTVYGRVNKKDGTSSY